MRSVLVSVAAVGSIAARRNRHLRSPLLAAGMCALLLSGCAAEHSHGDGARPARVRVPRPAQALLAAPKEPACAQSRPEGAARAKDEKGAVAERPAGRTEPGSTQGQADGALSQRIRLEFERNCFQQAEMRARTQLLRLQAAVGKTIRSLDRMKAGEAAGEP